MRRVLLTLGIGWGLLLSPSGLVAFQVQPSAMQQLKTRQKAEWRALKSRQAAQKHSMRRVNISRAQRIEVKHQMGREKRQLKEKQRDERQAMKDQMRVMKAKR